MPRCRIQHRTLVTQSSCTIQWEIAAIVVVRLQKGCLLPLCTQILPNTPTLKQQKTWLISQTQMQPFL